MATREIGRMTSLSNCSCLPLSSGRSRNTPVMLPPGCAKLRTKPIATGSLSRSTATVGMWLVASLAAASAAAPLTTRTATLSRTRSAASWDSRSGLPSACRYSTTTFRPSVYPSSPSPCLNASLSKGSMAVTPSIAIRGVLARGCASATSGAARRPALKAQTNVRRSNGSSDRAASAGGSGAASRGSYTSGGGSAQDQPGRGLGKEGGGRSRAAEAGNRKIRPALR